nr:hypothetical protein [uncultured Rhodopila sp.]
MNRLTEANEMTRIWVQIDANSDQMMILAALYVLYAVLDKTGGFPRKSGVTKKTMERGRIRSFIFMRKDERRVLRALNAYDAIIASKE